LDKQAIIFDGRKNISVTPLFKNIQDTFTYEFWVKPKALHGIDRQKVKGISGIKEQRYVIFPGHGGIYGKAGVGVSIGTNGISIYEHTQNHLPALLVFHHSILDWVHVAIVINNKTPYLFINGNYKKTGLTSSMNTIFASGIFGGLDPYGFFIGAIDDLRIWDHARTENQIKMNMNQQLTGEENGLFLHLNSKNYKEMIVNELVTNDLNKNHSEKKLSSISIPNTNHTIVIIYGGSAYYATCYFGFDLAKAFQQLGYSVELLNVQNIRRLKTILRKRNVFFILGMNGHGITELSKDLYNYKLTVPYFAYLVDHPMYHSQRFDFNSSSQNLIVSCVDKSHVHYLETYFSGNFSKVFVPHGSALSIPDLEMKPIKDRPIDILFAGSYFSTEECRNHWISDSSYKDIMDEIVENGIYENKKPLMEIAKETFLSKGIDFDYSNNERLKNLITQVDLFIRGRRRKEVLESLISLPLHVYHSDWSYLESLGGKVKVYPAINYDEFQKKMFESKIVLNVLPNLVFGGHDRIFTSMLAGSVSLTDPNRYLHSCFKDEENILMYKFQEADFANKVQQLLCDHDKLQEMSEKGKKIAQEDHTWLNRALQIIDHVQQHLG
jgi:glycosyltransferase involved in cell wall biosynthesis